MKELQSIVDYERLLPAVDPLFDTNCTPGCTVTSCSCILSSFYWSSTSSTWNLTSAWNIFFYTGVMDSDSKFDDNYIRAVRGGL